MALSGDSNSGLSAEFEEKAPTVRFDVELFVTSNGQAFKDHETGADHFLSGVIEVVRGDIDQVLHLIGHPYYEHIGLIAEDTLSATDEVNEKFMSLVSRAPASLLLLHDSQLYGVVINEQNECRVVGVIDRVVPTPEANILMFGSDGQWKTIRSRDININTMVADGVVFVLVSEGGYAFVDTDVRPLKEQKEMPKLTLVANKGYMILEKSALHWTRLQIGLKRSEFATKTTEILAKECVVTGRGGFLRREDHYEVFGSQNAVLDFDSLKNMMEMMANSYKQTDDKTEDNDEMKASDDTSGQSVEAVEGSVGGREVDSISDSMVNSMAGLDVSAQSEVSVSSDDLDDCPPDSIS